MKEINEKEVLAVTGGTPAFLTKTETGMLYIGAGAAFGVVVMLLNTYDFSRGVAEKVIFGGVVGGTMGGLIHMMAR